ATGPAVHIITTGNRREKLRWSLSNLLVAPEELTRLRIDSDDTFLQKLHVLFAAGRLNDNRRRIACWVATRDCRFPNDRARLLVKRDHGCLRAAGGYDNGVTINQRRLCIGPFARL